MRIVLSIALAGLTLGAALSDAQAGHRRRHHHSHGAARVSAAAIPDPSAQQCYGAPRWDNYVFRCAPRRTLRVKPGSYVMQYPFGRVKEDYTTYGMPGVRDRDYFDSYGRAPRHSRTQRD